MNATSTVDTGVRHGIFKIIIVFWSIVNSSSDSKIIKFCYIMHTRLFQLPQGIQILEWVIDGFFLLGGGCGLHSFHLVRCHYTSWWKITHMKWVEICCFWFERQHLRLFRILYPLFSTIWYDNCMWLGSRRAPFFWQHIRYQMSTTSKTKNGNLKNFGHLRRPTRILTNQNRFLVLRSQDSWHCHG